MLSRELIATILNNMQLGFGNHHSPVPSVRIRAKVCGPNAPVAPPIFIKASRTSKQNLHKYKAYERDSFERKFCTQQIWARNCPASSIRSMETDVVPPCVPLEYNEKREVDAMGSHAQIIASWG